MSQKISTFTILVRDMRKAQKEYFASRAPSDLSRAKALEKQVDARLKEIFACVQPQGSLLCARKPPFAATPAESRRREQGTAPCGRV